jgi:predicted ribosome quality control (RQC) complex YloA/Tae2 family protein
VPPTLSDEERRQLLAEVRALAGAALQKLWLPSAQVCVLQLRVPGRTQLVVLDARLSMAALAPQRPTSPDSAPRSQATLRRALEGAHFAGGALQIAADRRAPAPRLDFETEQGRRSLVAEEALLLLDGAGRIVWASSGAGERRRPGSEYPQAVELPPGDAAAPARRDELVQGALQREEEAGLAARRKEIAARIKSRAQRLRRALAAVDEDAARAARAEEDRRRAELLLPLASRVPRGAREALVPDWSHTDENGVPAQVAVALDPAFSAAENAARWLKKAKRYQAAAARIAARRAQVAEELARAGSLLSRAQAAQGAAELALVEAEVPASAGAARKREPGEPRLPYRTFRSQGGVPILVGRGARDNDALTFKTARGNDLWLHARGAKGAHVVIPGAGDSPDARVLGDAALLAAHFSSFRGADGVEIAWTRCKYVRKPRGAPAGSVLISQEKTLRVRLEPDRLAELLRTEGG